MWVKTGLLFVYFVALYAKAEHLIENSPIGIRKNVSNSLPYSYFLCRKITDVHLGMFVTFNHPKSKFAIAKQLIGLPGDMLAIRNQKLFINEVEYGALQPYTLSGQVIHPITEETIPQGYCFVYAPHPYSYDSRYAEFGLVPLDSLKEELWPLF